MPSHIAMLYNHFNHYQHLFLHQKQMSKSPVITKLVAPILHKRKIVITFAPQRSPDGGIGRRAGLKHQWSNPSRFDPGSGYRNIFTILCKSMICGGFSFCGLPKGCQK